MTLDKKALEAATDEAISSVADITARAKSMNLGLVKYFVPEIELLLAALATPPAKPGVQVAGLVWGDFTNPGETRASNPFGLSLLVWSDGDRWRTNAHGGVFDTPDAAKAAAFACYERIVLSALVSEGKP